MLMGLGSLATIGVKAPRNLAVIVLDNEHYGETGMQASHTGAGVDLVQMARACRFAEARLVEAMADAEAVRRLLHAGRGPVFVQARINNADVPRVLPTRDGNEIRVRFMQALGR
jgi:thiamine pyrophosphate-dependent acetolactate synthase large subunit-like protein